MKTIVGLGELLWDMLPGGACLGGAPANFAYITSLFGNRDIVASRVGQDARGAEALQRLEMLAMDGSYVQGDPIHPTGTVQVQIDGKGQARYDICSPVAWDFLEWTAQWGSLAAHADAVCFGSLAQRSAQSRDSIRQFLSATPHSAVRVFDVNLRQSYYSAGVLAESMRLADVVKLNDEELPKVMELCQLPCAGEQISAETLLKTYNLKMVCVTRGGRGSLLVRPDEFDVHPGIKVQVADTVGAGDAFTAGLVHEFLRGSSLGRMNLVANHVGAWVASETGAMPAPKGGRLENAIAEIRLEN